ncbi:MAG: DNA mismatch repair protein MutS [Desulfobulbus propionicus]|nr:MAG: DNA mismatch repair protein MutS [Desulfobulbus propionicus]
MNKSIKITPMLRQYLEIKEEYPDTILFYRMGDFYEMFFDDAETSSQILGITLTSRSSKDEKNKVPMCGIPYHALSNYLGKMIEAGYRVAICEQVEDPKQAKGIVKREVIKIVSPGVTTDEQILDEKSNCFVCALTKPAKIQNLGISFLDVSTGDFYLAEAPNTSSGQTELIDLISRFQPAEILIQEEAEEQQDLIQSIQAGLERICITTRPAIHFEMQTARSTLLEHFQTTNLAGFGCEKLAAGIKAAGALLAYIRDTQKASLSHIRNIQAVDREGILVIDESSRRNLELIETIIGGKRDGSLLSVLDYTQTPMGARILKKRLLFPLHDRQHIEKRLEAVQELVHSPALIKDCSPLLANIFDLERLCSRLIMGQGNARDMLGLKNSLAQLPQLKSTLERCSSFLLQDISTGLDTLDDIHDLIGAAIREDAPVSLREGRLICEGYNEKLDNLLYLLRNDKQLILNLEAKEQERTGIAKLKVGYNKVFGYFFEVSRTQAEQIPDDFIRKQTLVNAERFITPELKELEQSIVTAHEERLEIEYRLFSEIKDTIVANSTRILETAKQLARIDFLLSLAQAAVQHRYNKPQFNENGIIHYTEGRHPVIERSLEAGQFVPNDLTLDQDNQQLIIITGPNMAGKSTVLRQTALIVLMAHIGSFVPAASADLCLIDRIFTRVGAMDDLRRGQSTFMVEMNETANILNNATSNSLVILDEIGRGTSTYDGLAIAWAVAEDLVNKDQIGIKTLFATHYHELTELAKKHIRVQNTSIGVREWNDTIIFLHKLVQGGANRSYGIQVASLAGVPKRVTRRASSILTAIESGNFLHQPGTQRKKAEPCQLSLFHKKNPVLDLLQANDPDTLSPRQALDILYEVNRLINTADS